MMRKSHFWRNVFVLLVALASVAVVVGPLSGNLRAAAISLDGQVMRSRTSVPGQSTWSVDATGSALGPVAETTCALSLLSERAASLVVPGGSPAALKIAEASPGYDAEAGSLPANEHLAYNSIFNLWTFNRTTCLPTMQSVNVVFSVEGSPSDANFGVTEDPSLSWVLSTSVQSIGPDAGVPNNGPAADAYWNGYSAQTNGEGVGNGAYGVWDVPSESPPPAGCGNWAYSVCYLYVWVGQTVTLGGGPPTEGIAQAGSADQVTETYGLFSDQLWAWYEFYPANIVNIHSVASGDNLVADVQFYNNEYNINICDYTGYGWCSTEAAAMAMGAPWYSQFIAENPQGQSGVIPRVSNFQLFSLQAGGQIDLQDLPLTEWTQVGRLSTGPMQYYAPGCAGSCFSETYVGP